MIILTLALLLANDLQFPDNINSGSSSNILGTFFDFNQ